MWYVCVGGECVNVCVYVCECVCVCEWLFFSLREIRKKVHVICKKMDGTRGQCVKWNMPDLERQMPHVFAYMQNVDLKKDMNTKVVMFCRVT
jgi:hypothetical protein